jgi:hypothetical protein
MISPALKMRISAVAKVSTNAMTDLQCRLLCLCLRCVLLLNHCLNNICVVNRIYPSFQLICMKQCLS